MLNGANPNLFAVLLDPVANPDPDLDLDPNPPNPPVVGAGADLAAAVAFTPNPLAPKDAAFESANPPNPVPSPAAPKGVLDFSRVGAVGGAIDEEGTILVAKRRLTAGFSPAFSRFSSSTNRANNC